MESDMTSLTEVWALVESDDETSCVTFDIFKSPEGAINYLLNRKDRIFASLEIKTGQTEFLIRNIEMIHEWFYDERRTWSLTSEMSLYPIQIGD